MNTSVKNTRSLYWDNIKGFLMLLVVFAHILFNFQEGSTAIDSIVDCIYMFHMPAFVFVSGYFGKSERSCRFESIIRLVFLYFIFNSIMGFIFGFDSLLQPMYSYWYLLALIAWRLTTRYIARFKEIKLILFVIALFAGFYPSIDNNFAAARIICFYPFYMFGYQLSSEKSDELKNKPYMKRALTGIGALLAAGTMAFCAYSYFKYTDLALQMSAYVEPMDAFGRIVLYLIAFLIIYALRCLSTDRKIPLLSTFGRNSLWIFILHRPFTLLLSDHMESLSVTVKILVSVAAALIMCVIFGNDLVAKYMNRFLAAGVAVFTSDDKKFSFAKLAALCVSLGFIVSVLITSYKGFSLDELKNGGADELYDNADENDDDDIIFPVMTGEQKAGFDNAFRITFAGDLILLEDQVKRAFNGSGYDFSEVFEYAEPYISSADLAVGVFEGPMAGKEAGYTTSNFDDGKELRLNFPDEFASAVKNAGFDLVTTANNHLLDKGEEGALRTIDILDKIKLDHTGSYKSEQDKKNNRVKLVECEGLKLAFLSYTYGSNFFDSKKLADGRLSYLTSVIYGTEGEQFEMLRQNVEEDFKAAKALSPDLIVVLPHIGTQFSNGTDEEQQVWFDIFKENGADIILGDHPHAVEPALVEEYNGRTVFTAYCPGNFANIYREEQGDTSMLTDVYIDRDTKKVIGGSIVPLYTYAPSDGNFRAVPVYEIMNDTELRRQLTTDDIDRAANAHGITTRVVFGHEMDITSVTERYYFNEEGFIRSKATGLALTDEMKKNALYQEMNKAESICFVGDSVTEGTKNGGCPWYEPIEELFPDKEITNYSKGGCTASYMTKHADDIPQAGLYVIALGTNDVRYRDKAICAMTAESFTSELDSLKDKLSAKSPNAKFVFIAPWYSTDGDPYCDLTFTEKTELNNEYSAELEKYCKEKSMMYINANENIRAALSVAPERKYLLDHIHPNASAGVIMYSEAVLSAKTR